MAGISTITKIAVVATSLGGLVGGSYFFKNELKGVIQKQINRLAGYENIQDSDDVMAEYVYDRDKNETLLVCKKLVEGKVVNHNSLISNCESWFNNMWKGHLDEKPKLLIKVEKTKLEAALKERFYSQSTTTSNEQGSSNNTDSEYSKLKENLKVGVMIDGKLCKCDELKGDEKAIIYCSLKTF
ncbi:hypothetical protein MSUIS_01000 [Mycoplasma suis KI3806]|uniref:Uncharacterized protein n=1 Tax=Mycoplasma suis (strain KI_3806) TaxID=708248 RepID=F0V2X1_MYCS3|nr:hypothetical protein [Mycoplasma suis]CBZ40193.1 hypothetical protein MSUIS_01000 [Mycoplasma suis KI3806]